MRHSFVHPDGLLFLKMGNFKQSIVNKQASFQLRLIQKIVRIRGFRFTVLICIQSLFRSVCLESHVRIPSAAIVPFPNTNNFQT